MGGDLEYPPVFEPGSYSLAEKQRSNHSTTPTAASTPPIPAPRTKFLSASAASAASAFRQQVLLPSFTTRPKPMPRPFAVAPNR